ncbi:hypothetical protein [Nonomuraea rubra]|uniref:hypothetical protein n=1 Tax=Nonomuraea rubra TaxID=46180 RepID=UPI0033F91C53
MVVVPGLDCGKEEFHDVVTALLRRGLAVFATGRDRARSPPPAPSAPDYHHVIGQVIDTLRPQNVGLVGLSLGGQPVRSPRRSPARLLVIDGGQDVIPGVTNSEPPARLAPPRRYANLPHGDHPLGNARPGWLAMAADRISGALG